MTRWAGHSLRPAVSVETPKELSRSVVVTSPGADLARTCRLVHSSPSPEGLNRPEYDLNPIPPGCPRAELLGTCPRWVQWRVPTRLSPGHLRNAAAISAVHGGLRSPIWTLGLPQDSGCERWTAGAASQTHRASAGSTSAGIHSVGEPQPALAFYRTSPVM